MDSYNVEPKLMPLMSASVNSSFKLMQNEPNDSKIPENICTMKEYREGFYGSHTTISPVAEDKINFEKHLLEASKKHMKRQPFTVGTGLGP